MIKKLVKMTRGERGCLLIASLFLISANRWIKVLMRIILVDNNFEIISQGTQWKLMEEPQSRQDTVVSSGTTRRREQFHQ